MSITSMKSIWTAAKTCSRKLLSLNKRSIQRWPEVQFSLTERQWQWVLVLLCLHLVLYCTAQTISLCCSLLFHTTLSLVTMSTRTHWSKPEHTHRPCLSGLQSRLAIGWVDRVAFCKRLTVPATPTSTLSESFLLLWAGYSLEIQCNASKHEKNMSQFLARLLLNSHPSEHVSILKLN